MGKNYILNECRSIMSSEGEVLKKQLELYLLQSKDEIQFLEKEHKQKLKKTDSKKNLKVLFSKRMDELHRGQSFIKNTIDELEKFLIWSDKLMEKHELIQQRLIPMILASRGVLPKYIISANMIIKSLIKIRIALQNAT